jgi:hypothetical protein
MGSWPISPTLVISANFSDKLEALLGGHRKGVSARTLASH